VGPEAHAQATLVPSGRWQPVEADPPLAAGAVIDRRYRVIRLLGEGGMGRVYEAEHLFIRRRLALKLVRRDAGTGEAAARLLQEAVLAGKVPHATVVPVFDCAALPDGQVYVAMELLRGESLEQALARPQPAADVLRWLAEVARGLAAAHRAGIVHRDVKPANLFLARTPEGAVQPRILDFGIAKLLPGGDTTAEIVRTQAGALLGTPFYMAPERGRGEPGGPPSDLYSLGVILYEALTGVVPFVGEQFMEIVGRHLREAPLDPRQAAPAREIPDALAELVLTLLRKEPAERPADGEAVARALLGLVEREPGLARLRVGAPGVEAGPWESAATQRLAGPGDSFGAGEGAATQRLAGPGDSLATQRIAWPEGGFAAGPADRPATLQVGSGSVAGPAVGRSEPAAADRATTLQVGSGSVAAGASDRSAVAGPSDMSKTLQVGSGAVDGGRAAAGLGDSSVGRPRRGEAGLSDRAATRQVGSGQVGAGEPGAARAEPQGRSLRTVAVAVALLAAGGLGGWTALKWRERTGEASSGRGAEVPRADDGASARAVGGGSAAVPVEVEAPRAPETGAQERGEAGAAGSGGEAAGSGGAAATAGDRPADAGAGPETTGSGRPAGKRREPGKKPPRKAGTTGTTGREPPKIKIDVYDE
jgi:serine/threonine-protein kinase